MSTPETPEEMFARASAKLESGATDLDTLLYVAQRYVDKWSALVEEERAGAHLDGRASIYSGETYEQAADRWMEYRDLLNRAYGETDGPCCRAILTGPDHEHGCYADRSVTR